jgi:lipopolysaccharide/colanic/teichoic acid biosynthesis glycosyltransferase
MHGKDGRRDGMYGVGNYSGTAGTTIPALEEWYALDDAKPSLYLRFCKRWVDLFFSVVALVVLLPAFAVIAGLVRVKLGPGVLYRQSRVGRNGENFIMLKFRTMQHPTPDHADSDVESEVERATHKTSDHPRLTNFGRTLRRLSLDELPQLWNVIRGQMSLVGPRPELSEKVDDHGLRSHPRHLVRPGLTGEWQVTHRSTGIHLIHCFDDDMNYVARVNLWQDARIVVRTFGVVFGGKGI